MENYWFCTDHKIKLEQYTNRYSSSALFSIDKSKINTSLNNAIAVKKITLQSMDRAVQMAEEFFSAYPEKTEFECVGSICPKCKKIFASPRHFKTRETGEIELHTYKTWWIFRVPQTEREQQNQRSGAMFLFFRYILFAFLLNYTLLLEMKLLGKYRKVGMFIIFPLALLILAFFLSRGRFFF